MRIKGRDAIYQARVLKGRRGFLSEVAFGLGGKSATHSDAKVLNVKRFVET